MREIVLDTETTGIDPAAGHRVIELACIELINYMPTGRFLHKYIDPEREIEAGAQAVHGISQEFLVGKPRFAEIVDEFAAFIGDDPFVIHNAAFDIAFLNAEYGRIERPPFPLERAIDTLMMARRKFPGAPANLDALCRRFNIDLSERTKHSAVVDCKLLAAVYLELIGGRQQGFSLSQTTASRRGTGADRQIRPPRPHAPYPEEEAAHDAMIQTIKDPIWTRKGATT